MHERGWVLVMAMLSSTGCRSAPVPDAGLALVPGAPPPCAELGACERACDGGSGAACTLAGRDYEFAHGVAADAPRALALYERACRLGYVAGCYNVAVVLERGKGVPRDLARARELYAQVCRAGSSIACEAADRLARAGDGGR